MVRPGSPATAGRCPSPRTSLAGTHIGRSRLIGAHGSQRRIDRIGSVEAGEAGKRLDHAQSLGLNDVGEQRLQAGMLRRACGARSQWLGAGGSTAVNTFHSGRTQVGWWRHLGPAVKFLTMRLDRGHDLVEVAASQARSSEAYSTIPPSRSRLVALDNVAQCRATSARSSSAPDGGIASTDRVVANHWLDAPTISSRACSAQPLGPNTGQVRVAAPAGGQVPLATGARCFDHVAAHVADQASDGDVRAGAAGVDPPSAAAPLARRPRPGARTPGTGSRRGDRPGRPARTEPRPPSACGRVSCSWRARTAPGRAGRGCRSRTARCCR